MRVLCLHGAGTNADIFERQTAALRYALRDDIDEFEFIDGEVDSDAAPGIAQLYEGPYLCYYDYENWEMPPTSPGDSLAAAYEYLDELLLPETPGGSRSFDGIIAFSQGAALAASYLLQRAARDPFAPADAVVRFAIFICGSLPFHPLGKQQITATDLAPSAPAVVLPLLKGDSETASMSGSGSGSDYEDGETPDLVATGRLRKITIPTAHVWGEKDHWLAQNKGLRELCDTQESVVWTHPGGHWLPVDRESTEQVATMVRGVLNRASLQH